MTDRTESVDASGPFGQALLGHHRGERTAPLIQRDGETVTEHPIERF